MCDFFFIFALWTLYHYAPVISLYFKYKLILLDNLHKKIRKLAMIYFLIHNHVQFCFSANYLFYFSLQSQIMDHASYLVCLHLLLIFNSSVVCHDSNILKVQAPSYTLSCASSFSLGPCVSSCQSTFTVCAW